jgi:branched-chain amino acid aminotransferase group I
MAEIVYVNGSLVPRAKARISVFDHGFLYGYGLFETMRAYNGVIFLLERHLERLEKAAETIGINLTGIDLAQACRDTLQANGLQNARLRLTVSHGDADAFPWQPADSQPTVVVTAREYRPYPPEVYNRGFKVGVSSFRRSRCSSLSGIKSTNYLVSVMARQEAMANSMDEALLLNEDGNITEGSTSNVFFVKSSYLVTPSPESGILPGITRWLVMEIADRLGIDTVEQGISLADLRQFEEAFLTSSMMEIMPLALIAGRDGRDIVFPTGKITQRLMAAYGDFVRRATGSRQ